jgi:hypothetical protein
MPDPFSAHSPGLSSPLAIGFAISPADGADLPYVTRQIRVTGAAGNLAVVWTSGLQTVEPVFTGDVLDWRVTRVLATGTTATGLRGYC